MKQGYEAEENLLGMAMIDKNCAIKLLAIPESWFLRNANKVIYREINALMAQSLAVNSIALADNILGTSELKHGIDMAYLVQLECSTTSFSHFDSYKKSLFTTYKKGGIERVGNTIIKRLADGDDAQSIISYMQDEVFELLTDHNESKPESMHHFMKQVVDDLKWQHDNPGVMLGKQSGFTELDELINGFEPGKVYVIGGRPGMGKTQFAINLSLRLSKEEHTVIFSLEMPGKGLAKRALANISNLPGYRIDGSKMNSDEWSDVTRAITVTKDQNKIYIDETPGLSTAQMRARLKAHELKYGSIGCIVVDHIGLVKKNDRKTETEALAQISHELQAFAKDFKCPLIELVQLNRGVEGRDDKRPGLSDIKQTSAIEEDARVVMFPYRDEYYTKEKSTMPGITELIVAKNSDGQTKSIYFKHDMARARYETLEGYSAPEPQQKSMGKFK